MGLSVKIKTFKLEDLVGKKLDIRSFKDGNTELIVAQDIINGELFVLEGISHPKPVEVERRANEKIKN